MVLISYVSTVKVAMVFARYSAGLTSPSNQTGGIKDKTSNASKIPILRSRSASLSRPGSRCSRPRSRTESQPTESSESVVPTPSWKTHPNSVPVTASDSRVVRRNSESATGNRNLPGKDGKPRKNSESAVAAGSTNSISKNLPGRQNLDPELMSVDESAGLAMTETLDLACDRRTQGNTAETVGTASVDDNIRPRGSSQSCDRLSVGQRGTPVRRARRSCSLDRSKPSKGTR